MNNEKEILSILKDEQKSKKFFETLTGADVRRYLIYINSKARNIPYEENQIYTGNVYAGTLITPNNDIQNRFFDKIADALKNMKDNRCRGVALHYLINELHLFEDGNGRSGRCIFELLTNPEFSFENDDNFSHNNGEYIWNRRLIINKKQNGIKPYLTALTFPSFLVYKKLLNEQLIPNDLPSNFAIVNTYTANPLSEENTDLIYIDENIRKSLSDEEIKQINKALCDNNDLEIYSVSGLTMMIMQHVLGEKNEIYGENHSGVQYLIDKDEYLDDAKKLFKNWSKEDYIKSIDVANTIKASMLEAMLDIFEHGGWNYFCRNIKWR